MSARARGIGIAACLVAGCLVAGAASAQIPRGVNVTFDITLSGGGKPRIDGRTNLPDGIILAVSLQPNGAACTANCVPLEFDAPVANRQFIAGPFTRSGQSLAPGKYTLEITSSIARLQSVRVQAIIGPRGEYMFGRNVHPPEETSDENIVDYVSQVTVQ
jgi:hypothetical protein